MSVDQYQINSSRRKLFFFSPRHLTTPSRSAQTFFLFHGDGCKINFSLDERGHRAPLVISAKGIVFFSTLLNVKINLIGNYRTLFAVLNLYTGKPRDRMNITRPEGICSLSQREQKEPWKSEEIDDWVNRIDLTTESRCDYDSGVISEWNGICPRWHVRCVTSDAFSLL